MRGKRTGTNVFKFMDGIEFENVQINRNLLLLFLVIQLRLLLFLIDEIVKARLLQLPLVRLTIGAQCIGY